MQKAIHKETRKNLFSFELDKYETVAIIKASKKELLVCPSCNMPVEFISLDIPHFKHIKQNNNCELSLSHRGELQIEEVQSKLFNQIKQCFGDIDIDIDVWENWKRYHIITPFFKVRIFNEVTPYNYMSDKDMNFFVTEYPNVYGANVLKDRGIFYGFNINKDIIIKYDYRNKDKVISECPLSMFFINEDGTADDRCFKKRR